MSMKPTDAIIGPRRGTADQAMAFARKIGATRQDDLAMYLSTVYTLAPKLGIDPAIVVAQSALETSNWTDRWWTDRLNPAGIGITGDPQQNAASMTWENGEDAAIGQIIHLYLYAKGWPLPPELAPYAHLDPRRTAIHASNLGNVRTLEDLGTRWATVADYGQRISNRAAAIFPDLPDQIVVPEEPAMGYKAYTFDGLQNPVMLPDDIEVVIDIVPEKYCGWVRSCSSFSGQTKTTFHDTGTPGADAWNQRNYLHGGPRNPDGSQRQVGFNFAVDDKRIIQLTPLDEVTWAAGTPDGNRLGWHVEQCFGGSINFDKSLRNAIALHGGLVEAKGWRADTALVRHKDWSQKWCPAQVLNRNLWPVVLQRTEQAAIAAAGARTGGSIPLPTPYPAPVLIPELEAFKGKQDDQIPYRVNGEGWVAIYVADRVGAHRETRRRRFAVGSDDVGPPIKAGEQFDVDWLIISADFADTYYTPYGTRVLAEDTGRVRDAKGVPE